MRVEALKVGELAKRTGLTVRTLHHYDEIGLLRPSLRTEAGHRLYTTVDVARLQQVLSLRQLGFGLEEVRDCLGRQHGTVKQLVILAGPGNAFLASRIVEVRVRVDDHRRQFVRGRLLSPAHQRRRKSRGSKKERAALHGIVRHG